MTADDFLFTLAAEGGSIHGVADCTPGEVELARAEGRYYLDAGRLGFVRRPAAETAPDAVRPPAAELDRPDPPAAGPDPRRFGGAEE